MGRRSISGRNEVFLRFSVHAGAHQTLVVGLEKREILLEAFRYRLPLLENGVAVARVL